MQQMEAPVGIREQLNKNSKLYVGISLIAGFAVLGFSLRRFVAPHTLNLAPPSGEMTFYTCDEGATLFADRYDHAPPFDHNGQQAVKAYVFTCDGSAHHWIQYLEKWSDKGRKQLELMRVSPAGAVAAPERALLLVKKPGSGNWMPIFDPAAHEITTPTCPDGMGAGPLASVQP
jgi:hypothetical protein